MFAAPPLFLQTLTECLSHINTCVCVCCVEEWKVVGGVGGEVVCPSLGASRSLQRETGPGALGLKARSAVSAQHGQNTAIKGAK